MCAIPQHIAILTSCKGISLTSWWFSTAQWTQFLTFTFPLKINVSYPSVILAMTSPYLYLMWWENNLQSPNAVAGLQTAISGLCGIDRETLTRRLLLSVIQTSCNTSCSMQWICSYPVTHFRNNFNSNDCRSDRG